jgi:hypothetical protein
MCAAAGVMTNSPTQQLAAWFDASTNSCCRGSKTH